MISKLASIITVFLIASPAFGEFVQKSFQTKDGLILHGHLALPARKCAHLPVVLFLVGSGMENRYENIDGDTVDGKPTLLLKGIEEQILESGFAVFTYDKRGIVPTDSSYLKNIITPNYQTATAENLANDALSAFDFVKTFPEIDPARIAVLGHSEGTMLAVQLAEKRPEIHSLYMLGLLGRPMKEAGYYQGVTNMMRKFYLMDRNGDGKVEQSEYEKFAPGSDWSEILKGDQDGDGKISDQEARYYYERIFQNTVNTVMDDSLPWKFTTPRLWFRQYYAVGAWIPRHLKFCEKIHLFHGTVDIQTPFEDALALRDQCIEKKTPLASVRFYPGLGHAFSPRIGNFQEKDTEGPLDKGVARDVALSLLRTL